MLEEGVVFLQSLQQVHRLALGGELTAADLPQGLKERLCRSVDLPDFSALEAEISSIKSRIHGLTVKKLQL